jgi:hypothetical protein
MATGGDRIFLPLAVGVDSGWPQSLFFFSPEKSSERMVGGGVCSPEVGGGKWWRLD